MTDLDARPRRPRLALTGEWDLAARDALNEHLSSWLETIDERRAAVLDLREMTFADSSVLHELVLVHDRLADRGITLTTLCRRDSIVSRVIRITGLDHTLGLIEAC